MLLDVLQERRIVIIEGVPNLLGLTAGLKNS
jgi:hypothetical protein